MIGTCFNGILRIPHLESFLGQPVSLCYQQLGKLSAFCGWGRRLSGHCAYWLAKAFQIPHLLIEDGFLRSTGLGVHGYPPLSLVIDDVGIYYDANYPSRLESLIATLEWNEKLASQTLKALTLIRQNHLSKYNQAPECVLPPQTFKSTSQVLVIDQTFGDTSVRLGRVNATIFKQMLATALTENPTAQIWVKTHPDVVSGKKKGYLGNISKHERLQLLAEDISPLCLLEQIDKVYVATSQMGFEALMLNKPVVCFGLPWYAGWGLTDDRHKDIEKLLCRRNIKRSLEQLFAAAYLQYARYIDPATGKSGTIFDVIDYLIQHRQSNHQHNPLTP